jgi:hypothetical protein
MKQKIKNGNKTHNAQYIIFPFQLPGFSFVPKPNQNSNDNNEINTISDRKRNFTQYNP